MEAKAALMKVEFVLEVARKDPKGFLVDLERDPFRTLQASGIDLSPGETMAVIDIVHGTSHSPLAPRLGRLRQHWDDLRVDVQREALAGL
jgi:hypothetical protein